MSTLQPGFFEIRSTFANSNIKLKLNAKIPFLLLVINLKLFSNEVLKNLSYFILVSKLRLTKILTTKKKTIRLDFVLAVSLIHLRKI